MRTLLSVLQPHRGVWSAGGMYDNKRALRWRLRAGCLRSLPYRTSQHPSPRPESVRLSGRRCRIRRNGRNGEGAAPDDPAGRTTGNNLRSVKYVDAAFVETLPDKVGTWKQVRFNIIFKGDDWRGTPKGDQLEKDFADLGVDVLSVHGAHLGAPSCAGRWTSSRPGRGRFPPPVPGSMGYGAELRNHFARNTRNIAGRTQRRPHPSGTPVRRPTAGTPGRKPRSPRAAKPPPVGRTASRRELEDRLGLSFWVSRPPKNVTADDELEGERHQQPAVPDAVMAGEQ